MINKALQFNSGKSKFPNKSRQSLLDVALSKPKETISFCGLAKLEYARKYPERVKALMQKAQDKRERKQAARLTRGAP